MSESSGLAAGQGEHPKIILFHYVSLDALSLAWYWGVVWDLPVGEGGSFLTFYLLVLQLDYR